MANGISETRDKVSICASKHDVYKLLTEGESAPFNTMKDLFLAAAAWGVKKNLSVPLAKRVSVFTWTQFSLQEDIPFIHALLVSSGIGLELLLEQAKLLDLLEGYANGGIDELSEDLVAAGKPTVRWINKVLAEVADAPEPI
jgi:hypothetical protein